MSTERVSLFDAFRYSGAEALAFSKGWLSDPVPTAKRFTDALLSTLPPMDLLTEHEGQSFVQSVACNSLLAGRWAMSGYPTVTLGHKTAAVFMATKIRPEDAEEFVRIPWPAFAIRLPEPLLSMTNGDKVLSASVLLVTSIDSPQVHDNLGEGHRWWYKLVAETEEMTRAEHFPEFIKGFFAGISLWGFNVPTRFFAGVGAPVKAPGYQDWDTLVRSTIDVRSDELARALIVATCIHLSGGNQHSKRPDADISITARTSKARPTDTLPPYTSYEIKSSIHINLHHAMRDYVTHGGSAPKVQSLAAGHWKRVAYGKGHELRRIQFVAPYWRGDVDAPISARVK